MDSSTLIWIGVFLIAAWIFRGLITLAVIAAGGALFLGLLFAGAALIDLLIAGARWIQRAFKVRP